MTTETTETSTPAKKPISIVPLFGAPGAKDIKATPPKLTYRGGPLLTSVTIVTIFWGARWKSDAGLAAIAVKTNDFLKFVVTSPVMDAMAEYSVPGKTIGHGSFAATAFVATPAPTAMVKDSVIRNLLKKNITKAVVPAATPNTLYFVFTPPGTQIVDVKDRSCAQFCGYHNMISAGVYYAAMPYPDCSGCLGGHIPFDALTATVSHELCEAITDPVPGGGWYDDANGEIGDICAWKFKQLGGYNVQLEWSNKANACV